MTRWMLLIMSVSAALLAGGCAHPLSIQPNLANLAGSPGAKADKRVGLLVAEEDRKREVTTPGGGGDKVTYFPYRDMETAIYFALTESFASVSRVSSKADPKLQSEKLNFVVVPRLVTNSSSDSLLTWPPTQFSIELTCNVTDAAGAPVTEVRVVGDGRATFDEFKRETSLAASRAAEDVVQKLIRALRESAALR